jgi:hypothetical protein
MKLPNDESMRCDCFPKGRFVACQHAWLVSALKVALLVSITLDGYGHFNGQPDWNPTKRKLSYRLPQEIDAKDDILVQLWSGWIDDAIKLWNDVKYQTGWEFTKCPQDQKPDITFVFGNRLVC